MTITTFDCKHIRRPTQTVLAFHGPKRSAVVYKDNEGGHLVEVSYKGVYQGIQTADNFDHAKALAEKWQAYKK